MEMQPSSTAIAAGSSPDTLVKRRRNTVRLLTVGHLDRRTVASRRARVLAAELERDFGGGITKLQRHAIDRAAALSAIAEDLAARRLAGQPVSLDELLRCEAVAKRAVKAVLAERPEPPAPPRFSPMKALREEAARKAQGKEAREAVTEKALPDEHPTTD
jgi:hypothetical protein